MSKTKHNPPQKPKPNFIEFSKVQQSYLMEVRTRQLQEFNEAISSVYEELGILERIKKAPSGTYKLRIEDLSGVDIVPVKPSGEDN